jgi:hypothetical protein
MKLFVAIYLSLNISFAEEQCAGKKPGEELIKAENKIQKLQSEVNTAVTSRKINKPYYKCFTHDNLDGQNMWLVCSKDLTMLPYKTYAGTWLTGGCEIQIDPKTGNENIFVRAHSGLVGTRYFAACSIIK